MTTFEEWYKNHWKFGSRKTIREAKARRKEQKKRSFWAYRPHLSDDADFTRLLLALISPDCQSQGNYEFERIIEELNRRRKSPYRLKPNEWTRLLDAWIDEYHDGLRERATLGIVWEPPKTDDKYFVESMFGVFGRQCSPRGHRVGPLDCTDLTVSKFAPGWTGPAPFSKEWATAHAAERHLIRFRNRLMREEFDRI